MVSVSEVAFSSTPATKICRRGPRLRKKPLCGIASGYSYSGFAIAGTSWKAAEDYYAAQDENNLQGSFLAEFRSVFLNFASDSRVPGMKGEEKRKRPSGPKGRADLIAFVARLKPCPCYKTFFD